MRLPSYLRQKKNWPGIFEVLPKNKKENPIHIFSVEFLNDDGVKMHREIMMFTDPRPNVEHMGVRGKLLRRGKPSYLDNGLEVLNAIHNAISGDTFYGYTVLFLLGLHNVYATFFGQGDISLFDESCKEVVSSVRLLEPGEAPLSAPRIRYATGGLRRTDTKTLKQALNELPEEIAYLRRPILAIAKEDQELLGSGEADTDSLERAIQKSCNGRNASGTAEAHADILRQWLLSLPDHGNAWASPAWFVEGFLRGSQWFQG